MRLPRLTSRQLMAFAATLTLELASPLPGIMRQSEAAGI